MPSSTRRSIATYCAEPRHGHGDLLDASYQYVEPVACNECPACIDEAANKILGARALIEVDVNHINRKYSLYVTHVTRERREYGQSDMHTLMAPFNLRHVLEEAPRFNAKHLAKLVVPAELVADLVRKSRLLYDEDRQAKTARRTA